MSVTLKCKKRNANNKYYDFPQWDILNINRKTLNEDDHERLKEAHTYRTNNTNNLETILYVCSCTHDVNIEMKIVRRGNKYTLSDFEAGLHQRSCPFFSFKQHYNEEGNDITLTTAMLKAPEERQTANNNQVININDNEPVARINNKRVNTFNGLMYSLLDSVNIALEKHKYTKVSFAKQFLGRFLNTQVGVQGDETFLDYRKKEKDNQNIVAGVGFIEDEAINLKKMYWSKEHKKVLIEKDENDKEMLYAIDSNFIENIKYKKFNVDNQLQIYNKDQGVDKVYTLIVKNKLVMKKALQGIRNYNNFTSGPYFTVKIDSGLPSQEYLDMVRLFLQPIYISDRFILPVESNFERECIGYLEINYNSISLYKPTTLDRKLFLQNLQSFLVNYPEFFDFYKNVCDIYHITKVIRPDLFMLKEGKLFIFEFAGYIHNEEYLTRLNRKAEEFYSSFNNHPDIKYVEIKSNSMVENFTENSL